MKARACLSALLTAAALSAGLAAQPVDPALFSGMRWRMVGPFRGGRALTATGVPGHPERFYFGAVGGGVWRTDNAGRTWEPVFDGQPVASIGAVAVAPSSPDVLYVGSGEADMRSDISYGNGVYKSADGGKTWTFLGLADTRQIARVVVHPTDPDLVYVAALGHGYGPNAERGVFRSKDGGKTWTKVLFTNADTGAADLELMPGNPRVVLAAMWQTRRPPWNVYPPSNGPGSGLYRSEDGGDTWKRVTSGLPVERLGRIRVAFAPSRPSRVYALLDAKEGGLYVSDDAGLTFRRAAADERIWGRGWYFAGVTVDPKDSDVVYACNTAIYRSTDGGKTFLPWKGAPGGDDYHRLWIDPDDARRMVVASDQGTVVTVDGGRTWSSWYNQPTAQLYHVATDDRFPYWIYGAQQDSGAVATPVRTDYRGIGLRDWRPVAVGGENGYIVPDPEDPSIVWGGTVGRFHWPTLQQQNVDPTLAVPGSYRGEWTLPLSVSSKGPKTLWFGNQFVWKSTDDGRHWTKASPDLTREDAGIPPNLDPVTAQLSEAKGPRKGVVYAIAPSPLEAGRVWAGTDDGLVWLTTDGGATWANVTPRALTPWSKVAILEPSHFDAATVYAAVDRHRLDDVDPYVYRTTDGGKTWTSIAAGIPRGHFVNVVREDPVRRGLLYAGTEMGVYVSFDDGGRWQPLQLNLPNCSIRDLDARHGDLVAATHGRSFWVLDDLSPLRQIDAKTAGDPAVLFAPRPAVRLHPGGFQGTPEPKDEPMAENPKSGAAIDYVLKAGGPVTIEILDAKGGVLRKFSSEDAKRGPDMARITTTPDWASVSEPPSAKPGMHRTFWDLREAAPKEITSPTGRPVAGVLSPPGTYGVRLTAAGKTLTQPLAVVRDPRLPSSVTDGDLVSQHAFAKEIEGERLRVARAEKQAADLRAKIAARRKEPGANVAALDALASAVDAAAGPAIRSQSEEFWDTEEIGLTTLRRLASSLAGLQSAVESADAAPTPDARAGLEARKRMVEEGLARWKDVLARPDVPR